MRHAIHAPRGIHSFRGHATPKKIIRSTTSHCDKIIDRAHHARRFDRAPFCQPERLQSPGRDERFSIAQNARLRDSGALRGSALFEFVHRLDPSERLRRVSLLSQPEKFGNVARVRELDEQDKIGSAVMRLHENLEVPLRLHRDIVP